MPMMAIGSKSAEFIDGGFIDGDVSLTGDSGSEETAGGDRSPKKDTTTGSTSPGAIFDVESASADIGEVEFCNARIDPVHSRSRA